MAFFQPQSSSSTPSSLINYLISNPDAESDTAGWATFADAASTTPTDGTGGAPNSTWTRTTSTPLMGSGSFLFTKSSGASRQGEGVSFDFTIDTAFKAKMLRGYFDYSIASGTFVDNDMTVWIYDKTNAVLIPCVPQNIQNHTNASERFYFEFQTSSSSTSYRLILFIPVTTNSANTIKFDNFNLGPNVKGYGSPVTDWVTYTPTISGFGTAASVSVFSRKVGDSLQVRGRFTAGTVAASTASITLGFNGTNGNVTVDTNKINTTKQLIGHAACDQNSTTQFTWEMTYGTTTLVYFGNQSSTNPGINTPINGNAVTGTGNVVSFFFEVPILGWSSTTLLSQDADTRVCEFRSYLSADQTGVNTNNSSIKVAIASVTADTHGAFSTANNRFVAPMYGKFVFYGAISVAATNVAANRHGIKWYKNGSVFETTAETVISVGNRFRLSSSSSPIDLIAGDYVEMYFFGEANNSVSTLTIQGDAGGTSTLFSGYKLQGPAQIAASESMYFYANRASGNVTVTAGSFQEIVFNQTVNDSHGAYSTSTGRYTCSSPGTFVFNADLNILQGASKATLLEIKIMKNGATNLSYHVVDDLTNSLQTSYDVQTPPVSMIAGDYVSVWIKSTTQNVTLQFQNAGSPAFGGFRL